MHRLLLDTEQLSAAMPCLSREAAQHLKVLRPKEGELFELFDGRGNWRTCAFRAGSLEPTADLQCARRSARTLTLLACITKGSRWDWTIEKATELGVTRLVPVVSERTIVRIPADERAVKQARWQRIAQEAARQSDARWLPEILAPVTFDESLEIVRTTKCLVGALTNPMPPPIGVALAHTAKDGKGARDYSVFVGPEGDFTPDELAALLACATPVSFGTTVLRAETAAIYGVSVVKAFLDSQGED